MGEGRKRQKEMNSLQRYTMELLPSFSYCGDGFPNTCINQTDQTVYFKYTQLTKY